MLLCFHRLEEATRCDRISTIMDRSQIVHSDSDIWEAFLSSSAHVCQSKPCSYISKRETLEEFLDNFPTVSKEQAVGFLEEAGRALLAQIA